MKPDERIAALRKTQLFGQAPPAALKTLAARAGEHHLQRGEVLFTAGDTARGLYVVVTGAVRAFRESEEGREQTIHVERAGATLAEVPVFDNGHYPSTVMAEEDSLLLFLAREDVRRYLLENPEAALSALALLAGRLRKMAELVEQLSLQDVSERLATLLLEEARAKGEVKNGVSFSLPDPHHRIAARLGSVREVITRNLRHLIDDGVIAIRGHRITILDAAALKAKAKNESR